jgi:hypothetical protein
VWRLEDVGGRANGLSHRVDDGPPPARQTPGQRADRTRPRAERP